MTNRFCAWFRKATPLLTAGVLIQTNGCAVDLQTIVPGLLTSISTAVINNLVFGAFNLTA